MHKINLKIKKESACSTQSGYTVIELLFYISIFVVVSIVVINSMVVMSRSFRETTLQAQLFQASSVVERISREIRQASDINSISASSLVLQTKDSSGLAKTVQFLLSGTNIQLIENNVLTGNLNAPNIIVTSLSFTQINSTTSKAVKIILSVRSANDTLNRIFNFYNTIVLRGSY